MKTFYDTPTQVNFWDLNGDRYVGGIAYRDEIICGCCGAIFEIAEIYEEARADGKKDFEAIIPVEWIDFSEIMLEVDK